MPSDSCATSSISNPGGRVNRVFSSSAETGSAVPAVCAALRLVPVLSEVFFGSGAPMNFFPGGVAGSSSMEIFRTCTTALPPPWTWMPILPQSGIAGSASV